MAIETDELSTELLTQYLDLIHRMTGITMGPSKKTLLQGRLRPRIRKLQLSSYSEYLGYLGGHKDEQQVFINLVTTNETSFFRTQRVWDYFQKDFLPKWSAEHGAKPLQIWSAAASSGEEVYTIAMCCEEHRLKNKNFEYAIHGSDISAAVLAIAEKACYAGRSIETFKTTHKDLLEKYFEPSVEGFKVKSSIKNKVKFHHRNLFEPSTVKNQFDLVFLRNILIYFEAKDQEIVLANVGKSVLPTGLLIIGESESLNSLKVPFTYCQPLVYSKAEVARAA